MTSLNALSWLTLSMIHSIGKIDIFSNINNLFRWGNITNLNATSSARTQAEKSGVVESGAGAPALGSGGSSFAFAPGLSPAPMAAFPVPRSPNPACGFPAPGSPVGSCASHTDHQDGSWEGGAGWSGSPRPLHDSHPASHVVSGVPPGLFTPRRRRTIRVRPLRFRM